jgi:hypothetical protein
MNVTGYYIEHAETERIGGKTTLLAGPFDDPRDASRLTDHFRARAERDGFRFSDGGYLRVSLQHKPPGTLPRGRYTPASLFAPPVPGLLLQLTGV